MRRASIRRIAALTWLTLGGIGPTARAGDPFPKLEFLQAASLPANYHAQIIESADDQKGQGPSVVVTQADRTTRAVVQSDLRDLSSVPARRAAVKGYVNGMATTIGQRGFKVASRSIPDIEHETFAKPIAIDVTFSNPNGEKLYAHQEIFFTDKGFLVQVIGDDPEAVKVLTRWSKSVRPRPTPRP